MTRKVTAEPDERRGLDPRIFVAIVEESPTSVVITDPLGNIEYVNEKFTQLTGYSREETIGRNPRFLKSGLQQPDVYRDLWKAISEGREWRGELCNRKKNGELYWELAAISAIHGADGVIAHYLGVKEDITDRKAMEELLRHATAAAEAANRAKSRFLADMSHELRTPLNSILGFGQLMELQGAEGLTEKQREYLHWIREGGEHLLDMVNDVLDLSKVEAGKVELEKSDIDPGPLVRRVLTTVRSLAAKKHLRIEMSLPEGLGVLDADEVRIKQVLYNLLSNAVKFTPREKRIGVEARAEGTTLVFSVWDEGIGIPESDIPRIFEPYAQSRAGRTGEGTGLGLAIVKRLVELHGGAVSVQSTVDRGSNGAHTGSPAARGRAARDGGTHRQGGRFGGNPRPCGQDGAGRGRQSGQPDADGADPRRFRLHGDLRRQRRGGPRGGRGFSLRPGVHGHPAAGDERDRGDAPPAAEGDAGPLRRSHRLRHEGRPRAFPRRRLRRIHRETGAHFRDRFLPGGCVNERGGGRHHWLRIHGQGPRVRVPQHSLLL